MIRLLKRILLVVWLIVMFALGMYIASENSENITVVLFGYSLPKLSIGAYLLFTLLMGLIIGFFSTYVLTQFKFFKKSRQLSKVEKEVKQLRISSEHK